MLKNLKKLDSKTPDVIKTATKTGGAIGIAMGIGISALGGWLLGKWADSIANNDARNMHKYCFFYKVIL